MVHCPQQTCIIKGKGWRMEGHSTSWNVSIFKAQHSSVGVCLVIQNALNHDVYQYKLDVIQCLITYMYEIKVFLGRTR